MLQAWLVWLVFGLSILALELVGLFSRARGDTISESVWWLLGHGAAVVLVPLYIWLGWHLFVEFWFFHKLRETGRDDLALVVATLVLTALGELWGRRRRRRL